MKKFVSIVNILQKHAIDYADEIAIKFVAQKNYERLTYKQLDQRARAFAAVLQRSESYYDERAVILLPSGLDYIIAFLGCLYAGVIAVPVYPPRKNQHSKRVISIIEDSQAKWIITNSLLSGQFPADQVIDIVTTDKQSFAKYSAVNLSEKKTAFLQYTSGSTGNPKGVLISHSNINSNIEVLMSFISWGKEQKICSWLPPYHDMGLVGGILASLYTRTELTLMSPAHFFQSPFRWLEIISQERITITLVPNFAFDLCVEKIKEEQIKTLDLGCLQCVCNGAEPIQFDSIKRFINTFSSVNLPSGVIYPSYGLAEATLILTAHQFHDEGDSLLLNRADYELGNVRLLSESKNQSLFRIINCGICHPDYDVRIVNPKTFNELPEQSLGEIWASGPSIAQGYWNKPELTDVTFRNSIISSPERSYLRTGDLGFIYKGELYVTGRMSDLIIVRGINYYPQDIELSISQSHADFEPRGAAAFGIDIAGTQQLVVLQEIKREALRRVDAEILFSLLHSVLLEQYGLKAQALVLVKPYTLLKTSSGKIQRRAAREAFLHDNLNVIERWDNQKNMTNSFLLNSSDDIKAWLMNWFFLHLNFRLVKEDYDKSVAELGINSIAVAELSHDLQKKYGDSLEWLSVLEQCSINQLSLRYVENLTANRLVLSESEHCNVDIVSSSLGHIKDPVSESACPAGGQDLKLPISNVGKVDNLLISNLKKIYFNINDGISNDTTMIDGHQYINFSGYNYLGLSGDTMVTEATIAAIQKYGTSVSASRLVSGEKLLHVQLEKAIASLIGTEDCVVLPSGYSTNISIITHLFGKNDLIIHDELCHNSILQGARFSGAYLIAFPHNNHLFLMDFLEKNRSNYKKVLIVSEGVFSMDGDIPDVRKLVAIKKQFDTYLMLDEAHSMGVLGKTGRGIREYFGLNPYDIDIWMGTLSKAFASCGGYIAGTSALIENFKYTAAGFVYSAGISPANTAAALAAIEVMNKEPARVEVLHKRQALLLSLLKQHNIPTGLSEHSPIVPIIVGIDSAAIELSQHLKTHHILALPIIYPAVEKNLARVRLFVNCLHTEEQIYSTVNVVNKLMRLKKEFFLKIE